MARMPSTEAMQPKITVLTSPVLQPDCCCVAIFVTLGDDKPRLFVVVEDLLLVTDGWLKLEIARLRLWDMLVSVMGSETPALGTVLSVGGVDISRLRLMGRAEQPVPTSTRIRKFCTFKSIGAA